MPLYEFYCEPCHAIFTFRSARVDTSTHPSCPVCGKVLKREISGFAPIVKGRTADLSEGPAPAEAAQRLETVMSSMGDRIQALDDADAAPGDAVKIMREMAEAEGVHFSRDVEEAMGRIEAGEDPEKVDSEFQEIFDGDQLFAPDTSGASRSGHLIDRLRHLRPPRRDPTWHTLS